MVMDKELASTWIPMTVSVDPKICLVSLWGRLISSHSCKSFTWFEGMNLRQGGQKTRLFARSGPNESSEYVPRSSMFRFFFAIQETNDIKAIQLHPEARPPKALFLSTCKDSKIVFHIKRSCPVFLLPAIYYPISNIVNFEITSMRTTILYG